VKAIRETKLWDFLEARTQNTWHPHPCSLPWYANFNFCSQTVSIILMWFVNIKRWNSAFRYTVKPLLKDTSKVWSPPLTEHYCSAPFLVPHIDLNPLKYGHLYIQGSLLWSQ
jgi:hypothetical protein